MAFLGMTFLASVLRLLRSVNACSIGGRLTSLAMLLLGGMLLPGTARADVVQICDVSLTITQGQSITNRDPRNDCPGYTGTPDYIQGPAGKSSTADSGNRDAYSNNGTSNADSPYANPASSYWESNSGSFTFHYDADAAPILGASTVDTFLVTIKKANQAATAEIYYHVTVVPPPPTLTAVAPLGGSTAGGTSVVLTGTNFSQGATVSFGGTAAASVTVNSNTQISAITPAHAVGAVDVVVVTGGGSATRVQAFGYDAPPTVAAAFSPGTVATSAASTLTFTISNPAGNPNTLYGVSFNAAIPAGLTLTGPATTCSGGTAAIGGGTVSLSGGSVAAGASCTVTASASSTAAGGYSITPGAPRSSSPATTGVAGSAATLTVTNPAPSVASISPTTGSTGGGTPVTITGANFVGGDSYTATFGTTTVAAAYASATTLTATTPAGTGTVQVTVTDTSTNQPGTGSASYTYAAPVVNAVSPAAGPAGQQQAGVVVTGTNFTPSATVTVGNTAATSVTYTSATRLSVTLPALSAGTYDVRVTTGTTTSAASSTDRYTYVAAPTVTSVNPNSGPTGGATAVVITGTGFTGATAVSFGGAAATGVTVTSDTQISAYTPAGTAGAVTVSVTNAYGGTGSLAGGYTYVALQPPSVTQQPAAQTVNAGQTASFTAQASGYPAPGVQWQVSADNGTSYANIASATATTYTTPATTAADNNKLFRAVFTNSQGSATTVAARLTVVSPPVANNQTVTVAYDYTANASNITLTAGNNPTSYTVLTPPSHGSLSGTAPNLVFQPVTGYNGTDSFTFQASNAAGASNTATVTITVPAPTIAIAGTLPSGTRGQAYTATLTASGGMAPYSFRVASGALPPGLTLSTSSSTQATISGTPTASGTFTGTIAATDSSNPSATGTTSFSITVAAPTLAIAPPSLPGSTVGVAYSQTFSVSGGTSPYSYAITSGALPAGMTLTTGGSLSGMPSAGGTFTFTVTATDSSTADSGGPYAVSRSYSLAVAAPTVTVAPTTLPGSTVGQAYSQQVTASGGTAPYSYAITAGALPAGLTLSSSGTLSGTPSAGGTFTFTVQATDSSTGTGPYSGSRSYSLSVAAASVTINQTSIASGTVGQAYSQTFTASGGTAPYSFAIRAGALPPGLALSSAGVLSGTPTGGGSYTFTVQATDRSTGSGPYSGTRSYTATIAAPTIALAPDTLPAGKKGVAYSQQVSATGGTAPYSYAIVAGALPNGTTLANNGTISGTPSVPGTFNFTVRATDSSTGTGPFSQNKAYSITVSPSVSVTPTSLPNGQVYVAYSQVVTATGGQPPYTYAVTAGALPDGLSLDGASGAISGTPMTQGTFSFTVTATDATQQSGSQAYSVTVVAPAGGYTRTWVSATGDDANTCSRTEPCLTFAGAFGRTATGGEINCLDAGDYGSLTITHAVSILCGDRTGRASVTASGGDGVTVAAPAGAQVLLSGLDVIADPSTPTVNGVRFTSGGALLIRNATFRGLRASAIDFEPTAAAQLTLVGVRVSDSGSGANTASAGVLVRPAAGAAAGVTISGSEIVNGQQVGVRLETVSGTGAQVQATITRSVLSGNANAGLLVRGLGGVVQASADATTLTGNGYGVVANGAGSSATLAGSTVSRNTTGILTIGGAATNSAGGNILAGNGTDGSFTATVPNQ